MESIVLEDDQLRLEPLDASHRTLLWRAAQEIPDWRWMFWDLRDETQFNQFMASAMSRQREGMDRVFVIVDRATGRVLGSSRFIDIDEASQGVEVGWTWLVQDVWGGLVNPHCKRLMLGYAFDTWGAERVMLKTDHKNLHSQAAIRKLGAIYEGTLRHHRLRRDGTWRDTVVFSVLRDEWSGVRTGLDQRIRGF